MELHLQPVFANLRDEVRSPTLDRMRLPLGMRACRGAELAHDFFPLLLLATLHQGGGLRLGQHNLRARTPRLDGLTGAGESAARAVASHPAIQLLALALERRQDFRARGLLVVGRVRLCLELPRQEPAVLLRQFLGLLHHASATQRSRRYEDLRPQGAHHLAALDGEGRGHHRHEVVPALRADHGQGDASIARSRLHHRSAGLELAGLLRRLDD
mmetsp:Transcript_86215/g.248960  ORF Transcript_86215/g.248960 Transcript_86215/m.248960 type:complete len:214 (+) Transcript_86215:406-1047(+)